MHHVFVRYSPAPESIIVNPVTYPNDTFKTMFLSMTNNRTGVPMDANAYNVSNSTMDYIQFTASYTCRNMTTNTINPNIPYQLFP